MHHDDTMTTDEKIQKLIKTSLFLDEERKAKLQKVLAKLSEKDKEKLLEILESEKKAIKDMVKTYIEKNGEKAISRLDMFINQGKGKIRKTEERKDRQKEQEQAENLLEGLNNL